MATVKDFWWKPSVLKDFCINDSVILLSDIDIYGNSAFYRSPIIEEQVFAGTKGIIAFINECFISVEFECGITHVFTVGIAQSKLDRLDI